MRTVTVNPSTRRRLAAASAAGLLVLTLGACSSKKSDDKADETTTTTAASAATETTEDATSGTSATDAWQADAQQHTNSIGKTFDYTCTPDGTLETVWGAGTYTDDSSVCSAAVQMGLITVTKGGDVTIEMAAGRDSYDAGVANGVTSLSYGSWPSSFTFPDAPPGSVEFELSPATWSDSAKSLNLVEGDTKTVSCSANGTAGSVWGSDPFTADSSICTAGVLAGVITLEQGGEVSIKVTAGENSYTGSTANGVTSSDYPAYDLSYTIERK